MIAIAWTRVDALPAATDEARRWLFGIARNVRLHAHRGSIRRSRLADRPRATLSARSLPAADRSWNSGNAIDRLDGDLAELVRLVHWDAFTLAEAAILLGHTVSDGGGPLPKSQEGAAARAGSHR